MAGERAGDVAGAEIEKEKRRREEKKKQLEEEGIYRGKEGQNPFFNGPFGFHSGLYYVLLLRRKER